MLHEQQWECTRFRGTSREPLQWAQSPCRRGTPITLQPSPGFPALATRTCLGVVNSLSWAVRAHLILGPLTRSLTMSNFSNNGHSETADPRLTHNSFSESLPCFVLLCLDYIPTLRVVRLSSNLIPTNCTGPSIAASQQSSTPSITCGAVNGRRSCCGRAVQITAAAAGFVVLLWLVYLQ